MQEITIAKAHELIGGRLGTPLPPPDKSVRNANIYYYNTAWGMVMMVDTGPERMNWYAYSLGKTTAAVRRSHYVISEQEMGMIKADFEPIGTTFLLYNCRYISNPGVCASTTAVFNTTPEDDILNVKYITLLHAYTTLPRAEALAILAGLKKLKGGHRIEMLIGNKHTKDTLNTRMDKWANNKWRNFRGLKVSNVELWEPIYRKLKQHEYTVSMDAKFNDILIGCNRRTDERIESAMDNEAFIDEARTSSKLMQ